jgi:O-antigen/teichoic acid export membrane protein
MSIKKNFFYNFLLTGSNLLFPLLTFPYLSRILGAEGLGICNFIMSYGQNYMIIAALGITVYGTREIAKVGDDKAKRSKLFFELLSIHLFFTFVLLAIYISSILLNADFKNYKDLALLGGSVILFNVFSIEWLFTGVNDFKYITIRSLFIRAFSIFAIFLLVKKREDFTIYFVIQVCTIFFTVLVDVYYARKFISSKIILTFKGIFSHIKPIFVLGIYIVLTSIYTILPTTLLGFLSTKSAVGYYFGANKIIRMIISVFSALIAVMIPKLNLILAEKGKEEYLLLVNKSLNIVVAFGIPITFFVFLLANPLVMLLAGRNFINSILVIQIMAPIILIVAFAQVFVLLILNVHRKDNSMVILSIIGMIISLLINLIFISHFAEKATAISQLVAEFSVTFISFFLAKRALDFDFPTKLFLINLVFVIPFAIITYLSFKFFKNNFLIIIVSSFFCGLYFIFYQLFILKDKFIIGLVEPYLIKCKKEVKINR